VDVALDPSLRPAENARRYYDDAGRRSRAEARLPELLAAADADLARWRDVVAAGEAGALPESAVRILRRLDAPSPRKAAAGAGDRKPYRVYRTSGGLEVRVGRSSRDNDRLTFGHCSPNEVWLHARSVPGSHVILRWANPEAAPPARDLEEAAVLAAVHSKARTSGTVAVDWTRRKHVRKPRGAPPGSVRLLQAKTVMVEPDPAVEERLRVDEAAE
jgi:predicted ribosome quality control (RQC) complex YloA/Tae2 family protein